MLSKTLDIQLPYRPMPKQGQAHALRAKYRGFCGGWGNGKTSWGCVETFALCHEFPGTNCIIARKTRPELKSTTWDMFLYGDPSQPHGWHGLPPETVEYNNRTDLHLKFTNNSQVWGLPLDDPRKLENYNLGLFWVDQAEEIEEEIFLKFQGRLRQANASRMGLLSFNPAGHNWLWRRFIDPDRLEKFKRLYQAIEATTFDNPNLPADYFDQFEGLPDHWLQRFVYGSHEVFVGQIFTDFNPEIHVVQPFRIPADWERWMCIDPGIRHEGAISYCARDPEGNVFYYRELLAPNQPVSWWSDRMGELERGDDWGGPGEIVSRRLIGPEARHRAQTDGKTVLDWFYEHGIYPEIADRDPVARVSVITEYLRPRRGHRNPFTGADPSPRLYIFATCSKMLEYLPQYRWQPSRPNYTESDSPEKPRKKDDHNIDNLGHILLALTHVPPVAPSKRFNNPERQLLEDNFWEVLEEHESQGREHPTLGTHF